MAKDDDKDGITPGAKLIPLTSVTILKAYFKPNKLIITAAKKIKDKSMAEVDKINLTCEIKNNTTKPLKGAFLAVKESIANKAPLFELLSTEYFKRTKNKAYIMGTMFLKNPIKVGEKKVLTWAIPVSNPDEISDAFFNKLETGKETKMEGIEMGVIGVSEDGQKIIAASKTEDIMVKKGPVVKAPPGGKGVEIHIVACPNCQSDVRYDGPIPDDGIEVKCHKCRKQFVITKDGKVKPSKSKKGALKTSGSVYFCLPGASEGETPPDPKDPPAYVVEPGGETIVLRRCTILNLTDELIYCTGIRIWGENPDTGEKFGGQGSAAVIVNLSREVKPQSRSAPFVIRIPLGARLRPIELDEKVTFFFEVSYT